jgi:20S proteasome subunit beta 6
MQWYQYQHAKNMSTPALAQMLSTVLYGKRFFPYFVWNTLGGLDQDGTLLLIQRCGVRIQL